MYITLDLIRQHLNLDKDFHEDDELITFYYLVAEGVVQKDLNVDLEDLENDNHDIPAPIKQAMLLYIGDQYNNREINAWGVTPSEVPMGYRYLLDKYRNYGDTSSDSFYAKVLDSIIDRLYIEKSTGRLLLKEDPSLYVGSKGKAIKRIESELIKEAGNLFLQQNQ